MATQKNRTAYVCDNCGFDSVKWYGKCPSCGAWNTMREFTPEDSAATGALRGDAGSKLSPSGKPEVLSEISESDEIRFGTGFSELDRVLGGGAVKGALVLIGGEPGIGKSTLMLQISQRLSDNGKVLYASGEESKRQIKLRAGRLQIPGERIMILSETRLEAILSICDREKPNILIVDSIQTVYQAGLNAAPGNISQIKECAMTLLRMAKATGTLVFIVGHVNKDGEIAGPKILEHMVDCVLYFEGDQQGAYRILRAAKNRFGSTNEIGVFEMGARGLEEVTNPSAALLSGRPENVPGSVVTATMEGTRPILAEVQALVCPSVFGNPRRMTYGMDYNRAALLMAVLEKRAGLLIGTHDIYLNVTGGLRIDEPAADLAAVVALASSFRDKPVRPGTVVFGEVGLTGELRRVHMAEQRLAEAARLQLKRCICPAAGEIILPGNMEVIRVNTVREALDAALV